MPPRSGLFDFLALSAIKAVGKLVFVFIGLTAVPLYLIFWLKRRNQPPPIIKSLNQCIQHGQTLSSEECGNINRYIKEIEASLESFRQGKSLPSEANVSLAQAIEALPLIYEISQPNTCCEYLPDELNYPRGVDCKSSLRTLLEKLEMTSNLPVISEELEQIAQVRKRIKAASRRRKPLFFLSILVYSYAAILLSQTILFDRSSWMIELGIYLGCLMVFFLNYDYYYSKEFRRYQKALARWRFFKVKA